MTEIEHRMIGTNGIRMHLAEQGTGPLVLLCHGFPECWYSWRHQLAALAAAGFHAVAPDMRGYGQTDRPEAIEQYTLFHLVGDMVGLLDALGEERAVIAGHDWGAPVAWHAAQLRPDRFRAVIGLSVPFRARGPVRPTRGCRAPMTPSGTSSISRSRGSPRRSLTATCARPSASAGSMYRAMRRRGHSPSVWCPCRAACSRASRRRCAGCVTGGSP